MGNHVHSTLAKRQKEHPSRKTKKHAHTSIHRKTIHWEKSYCTPRTTVHVYIYMYYPSICAHRRTVEGESPVSQILWQWVISLKGITMLFYRRAVACHLSEKDTLIMIVTTQVIIGYQNTQEIMTGIPLSHSTNAGVWNNEASPFQYNSYQYWG